MKKLAIIWLLTTLGMSLPTTPSVGAPVVNYLAKMESQIPEFFRDHVRCDDNDPHKDTNKIFFVGSLTLSPANLIAYRYFRAAEGDRGAFMISHWLTHKEHFSISSGGDFARIGDRVRPPKYYVKGSIEIILKTEYQGAPHLACDDEPAEKTKKELWVP